MELIFNDILIFNNSIILQTNINGLKIQKPFIITLLMLLNNYLYSQSVMFFFNIAWVLHYCEAKTFKTTFRILFYLLTVLPAG